MSFRPIEIEMIRKGCAMILLPWRAEPGRRPADRNYEKVIHDELEIAVNDTEAQVLIIDNITYMCQSSQHTRTAQSLMKMLKQLKTRFNISILVLAHTPKRNAYVRHYKAFLIVIFIYKKPFLQHETITPFLLLYFNCVGSRCYTGL